MRKICPNDPKHNPYINPGDNYCFACGAKLEEKDMTCECGADYGVSDHFCPNCGRPLR